MIVDTGRAFAIKRSYLFGQDISVKEQRGYCRESFGTCARCGHPLRRHWWAVYATDGGEICRIGRECVKTLS